MWKKSTDNIIIIEFERARVRNVNGIFTTLFLPSDKMDKYEKFLCPLRSQISRLNSLFAVRVKKSPLFHIKCIIFDIARSVLFSTSVGVMSRRYF